MPNTELLMRLRELHEELSAINDDLKTAEQVDDATVDALGQLVTDAGGLVDQAKATNLPEVTNKDVSENHELLDQVMKFETQHPRVIRFLSQLTDLLAMMGI